MCVFVGQFLKFPNHSLFLSCITNQSNATVSPWVFISFSFHVRLQPQQGQLHFRNPGHLMMSPRPRPGQMQVFQQVTITIHFSTASYQQDSMCTPLQLLFIFLILASCTSPLLFRKCDHCCQPKFLYIYPSSFFFFCYLRSLYVFTSLRLSPFNTVASEECGHR